MNAHKPLTVIHVDDDPGFLRHLKGLLDLIPGIEYVKGFTAATQVLDYLKTHTADLIFMDVEMPGKNGLWLAKQIAGTSMSIVFVTAHARYAIQAFEVCALDYLQKPPDSSRLQVLIDRLRSQRQPLRGEHEEQIDAIYHYLNPTQKPNRIFINMVGHISVIKLDNVLYFSSSNNYTIVITADGEKQTASKTIKTFEEALVRHPDFLRISRSYIVNKNFIRSIQRNPKTRRITVTLENTDILDTSYKTKEEIMEKLN